MRTDLRQPLLLSPRHSLPLSTAPAARRPAVLARPRGEAPAR